MKSFTEMLIGKINEKKSHVVVGLDPDYDQLPISVRPQAAATLKEVGEAVLRFNQGIIDAVHDLVPVVKPQVAFYERYGIDGIQAGILTLRRMSIYFKAYTVKNDNTRRKT